jgi:hypothetical protein
VGPLTSLDEQVQAALGSARHAFLKHFKRGLTPLGKLPPYERRRREEHALHAQMPEAVIAGRETKILIDQIRTIDVSYVVGDLIDYLSRDDMTQVEHSLSRYFGLLR